MSDAATQHRLLAAVRPWLLERQPAAREVRITDAVSPTQGGFSNGTDLFTVHWTTDSGQHRHEVVLRTPPSGPTLLHVPTLPLQSQAMSALADTAVPVPRVVWDEPGSGAAAPYFLMSRVDGRPGTDSPPYTRSGWIMDLAPVERHRLHVAAIEAMASLHLLDLATLDLPALGLPLPEASGHGAAALSERLGYCGSFYEYAARLLGQRNPHVERGLAWLEAHQPTAPAAPVLTWGDSRIGNLLFEEEGVEVTALLDWEFACLASPAHDIAHWLYAQRYFTEGIATPLPAGIPDRSETIAIYESLTGLSLEDLPYYDVMLAVNGAINGMRVASISIEAGWLPPDTDLGLESGGTHILRRLLGDRVAHSSRSFAKG